MYVTAIPTPSIAKAKKPGTNLRTDAPHAVFVDKFVPDAAAVLTSSATGPIKLVPTKMDMNPPIKFAIMLNNY